MGRFGSCSPGARAAHGRGDHVQGVVLADDPAPQVVLHVEQLVLLAFEHLVHGDAGPLRDDLGDLLGGDLLGEHGAFLLQRVERLLLLLEVLLQLHQRSVPDLGGALEVALALRALQLGVQRFALLLELAQLRDGALLVLPAGLHAVAAVVEVGDLLLDPDQPVLAGGVGLLLEGLPLDLELHELALELIQLLGHGIDLHAHAAGGFVHQIDGLVRQEAVGDVAVRERRGGDQRGVLDADAVVHLVALLQAAQDRDRVLDAGLAHEDGLEAPLEGGVLLHVLAVLVERGGADAAQLAARQRGLQHVGGVGGALGGAGAHDGVQLVDEEDDLALGLGDLAQHGLQAVLELAAILRARDHAADVEAHDAAVLQRLGHVAGHDALGQALDDGGLADARLADQHGVVLGAAREHLHHAADLLVAPDHGVELAAARHVGEVAAELLERLVLRLCVGVGDAGAAAHRGERLQQRLARGAGLLEGRGGRVALLGRDRQQQMLARDVLVLEILGLAGRRLQHALERVGGPRLAAPGHRGGLGERLLDLLGHLARVDAELLEDGRRDAVGLRQERAQQMRRLHGALAAAGGQGHGLGQGFLGLDGELVESHARFLSTNPRGATPVEAR